jgi:DNA polymerase III subunit beta
MKISCLQENLSKGLNITNRVIPLRGSLPILSNVLLNTEKGRLKLSGTNLEIGINYWTGAKVEKKGGITVPAKVIGEYINSLPQGKIKLNLEDKRLIIKSDNYEAKIFGVETKEFPLIPEIKEKPITKLTPKKLLEGISQVIFAAALDESRPILSGVYFNFSKDKLYMTATDSYRLSEKIINLDHDLKKDFSMVIPVKTISELSYILSETGEPVEISLSENQVLFRFKDIDLVSKLIEGEFPNYKQIIPEASETKVKVNLGDFIKVVKLANIFAREGAGNVKLEIKSKGQIVISATTASLGNNISNIKAEVEGVDSEITFNTKYLLDVLNNIKSEQILLELNGKLNPGMIKPVGQTGFLHIIMPLRV